LNDGPQEPHSRLAYMISYGLKGPTTYYLLHDFVMVEPQSLLGDE